MNKKDFKLLIYQSSSTVFTTDEIALLLGEVNRKALKSRINYYVGKEVIRSVKKGIYVKPKYNRLELATKIYKPSYISLETVLRENDIIFQYDNTITAVSYLSRTIEVDGNKIIYRKIKDEYLFNNAGIISDDNYPKAGKERAFIDTLYLYKHFNFDNLEAIEKKIVFELTENFNSPLITRLVKKHF